MNRNRKLALAGIAVLGLVAAPLVGTTVASSGDIETPITGAALDRASAAALAHTGGGRVSETEAGDEDGAYEVEVTLPDGSQRDVHLNADFSVIGSVADVEEAGDTGP